MTAPDTGEADARLAAALASPLGLASRAELLAALVGARVFAAITATATAEGTAERTGLKAESSAEMAVVLLETAAGDRALPVFPDLMALRRWRLDARPVPLTGSQACAAALDVGAVTVLIDPAEVSLALDLREVEALARGWVPVAGSSLTARRAAAALTDLARPAPDGLVAALQAALEGEGLRSARLLQGPEGLVLGVAPSSPTDPAALAALASRVVARLGSALPAAGLDLTQVPPEGPGRELLPSEPSWSSEPSKGSGRPNSRGWLRRGR